MYHSSHLPRSRKKRITFETPFKKGFIFLLSFFSWCMLSNPTLAVPSFARQTGMQCAACHVGSFGPQLTSYGRSFKLGGYTARIDDGKTKVPLSAMFVGVFDKTSKKLPSDAGPFDGTNNNFSLQEASLFLAGRVTDNLGGFIQTTYSDIEKTASIDNMDIRYAFKTSINDANTIIGISLNNNPTNQDPWNTVPAWRFPYMSADLAPAPGGDTLLAGGLEQQVMGMTGYLYWNDNIYAELGGYVTPSTYFLQRMNVVESKNDISEVSGVAPYWRFTYTNQSGPVTFSTGLFGMHAKLKPGRVDGPTDKYQDTGIDASLFIEGSNNEQITVNTSYIHEKQTLDASFANGDVGVKSNALNNFNLNASYYLDNTYGLTLGFFDNGGTQTDATLYAPDPVDGSRVGKPNSNGYVIQADWTPFGKDNSLKSTLNNIRLGAQYTIYNKFNGASSNYDGSGRDAKDNNTLMVMLWLAI